MKKILFLITLVLSAFLVASCKKEPKKPTDTLDLSKIAVPSGRVETNFTLPAKLGDVLISYEITKGKHAAQLSGLEVQVYRQTKDTEVELTATAGELTHSFSFTVAKLDNAKLAQYQQLEQTLKKAEFTAKAREIYEKVPVLSTVIKLIESQISKLGLDKVKDGKLPDDGIFGKLLSQFKNEKGEFVLPEKLTLENPGLLENYIDLYNTIQKALKQSTPKLQSFDFSKLLSLLTADGIAKLIEDNFVFKKDGKEDLAYKKQVIDFIKSELNQKSIDLLLKQVQALFPKLPNLGAWQEIAALFPSFVELGKSIYALKLSQSKLSNLKDQISAGNVVEQSKIDVEIANFKAAQTALNKAVLAVQELLKQEKIQDALKAAFDSIGKFFYNFAQKDLDKIQDKADKAKAFQQYQDNVKAFQNIHEFILGLILKVGNKSYTTELKPGGDKVLYEAVSKWSRYLVDFISKDGANIHPAISSIFSLVYGQVFGAKTGTIENYRQLYQIGKYFKDPQDGQDAKIYTDLVKLLTELKVMSER